MSGYPTLPKILDEPYFLYVTLNQQYIYVYFQNKELHICWGG